VACCLRRRAGPRRIREVPTRDSRGSGPSQCTGGRVCDASPHPPNGGPFRRPGGPVTPRGSGRGRAAAADESDCVATAGFGVSWKGRRPGGRGGRAALDPHGPHPIPTPGGDQIPVELQMVDPPIPTIPTSRRGLVMCAEEPRGSRSMRSKFLGGGRTSPAETVGIVGIGPDSSARTAPCASPPRWGSPRSRWGASPPGRSAAGATGYSSSEPCTSSHAARVIA